MKVDGRNNTKVEVFYNLDTNTMDVLVQDSDGEWSTAELSYGKSKQLLKAMTTCVTRLEEAQ